MEIKLRIHSVVDVITNSSTVIYTNCDDSHIGFAKQMVDMILKEAGSDKTADDLFTFKLALTSDAIERLIENDDFIEKYGYEDGDDDLTWEENAARIDKFFADNDIDYEAAKEFLDGGDRYSSNTEITITTKDGKTSNFTNMILKTVEQDSSYDG